MSRVRCRPANCPLLCVLLRAGTFCPSLGMCQLAGALSEKSCCWKPFCVLLRSQHRFYGYHSRGIYVAKNILAIFFFSLLSRSLGGSWSGLRLSSVLIQVTKRRHRLATIHQCQKCCVHSIVRCTLNLKGPTAIQRYCDKLEIFGRAFLILN